MSQLRALRLHAVCTALASLRYSMEVDWTPSSYVFHNESDFRVAALWDARRTLLAVSEAASSHLEALDEGATSGLDALLDLLIAPPTALVEVTESGSNSVGRSRFIELLTPFRPELVEEREFLHFEALPENVAALALRIAAAPSALVASAEDLDVLRGWGAEDPLAVRAFSRTAVTRGAELLGRLGYDVDPAALIRHT